jgi:hypothetical protein
MTSKLLQVICAEAKWWIEAGANGLQVLAQPSRPVVFLLLFFHDVILLFAWPHATILYITFLLLSTKISTLVHVFLKKA